MFGNLLKGHTGIVLVICRYWIIFLILLHMIQHLSLHLWLLFSYGLNTWVINYFPWTLDLLFLFLLALKFTEQKFELPLHHCFFIANSILCQFCFNFLNIYKYLTRACSGRWISFVLIRVSHHLHFYT